MAGERRYDDPAWVDVSAFLAELEAAYPPSPRVRGTDSHFAAIAQETRRLRARAAARTARRRPARRSRLQLLAAWVIAATEQADKDLPRLATPTIVIDGEVLDTQQYNWTESGALTRAVADARG